ncbi:MAG: hypothetical protein JSS56_22500 [Proteobacteria bacterium]|nr:hypothetical protein [Pseudomonadota bacterium]
MKISSSPIRGFASKVIKVIYWSATGQLRARLASRKAFRMGLASAAAKSSPGCLPSAQGMPIEVARALNIDFSLAVPFSFPVHPSPNGRLAAVIHLYYPELAVEIRDYLNRVPFELDVFISARDDVGQSAIAHAFKDWPGIVDIRIAPNRGRDIAPKLITFRDVYARYAYVLHLHTKRSPHASILAEWRHYLFESLCGNPEIVKSIMAIFEKNSKVGIIAPQHFEPIRHLIGWGKNFDPARALAQRMGLEIDPKATLDFPSGSMFWARSASLQALLDLNLSLEDFDKEEGQIDATFAHAVERLYFYTCERSGYDWVKITRPEICPNTPSIVTAKTPEDLEAFFNKNVFRLLDPGEVRPRTQSLRPIEDVPAALKNLGTPKPSLH